MGLQKTPYTKQLVSELNVLTRCANIEMAVLRLFIYRSPNSLFFPQLLSLAACCLTEGTQIIALLTYVGSRYLDDVATSNGQHIACKLQNERAAASHASFLAMAALRQRYRLSNSRQDHRTSSLFSSKSIVRILGVLPLYTMYICA